VERSPRIGSTLARIFRTRQPVPPDNPLNPEHPIHQENVSDAEYNEVLRERRPLRLFGRNLGQKAR